MAEVPFNAVSSSRREIKIVAQVVNRLLDRDKPLLPAYISLNEIRQIFEKVQGWTFFRFASNFFLNTVSNTHNLKPTHTVSGAGFTF